MSQSDKAWPDTWPVDVYGDASGYARMAIGHKPWRLRDGLIHEDIVTAYATARALDATGKGTFWKWAREAGFTTPNDDGGQTV